MLLQEISSPWFNPTFLLSASGIVVALVVWLVRVEFVGKANEKRTGDGEQTMKEMFTELRDEIKADRADTREWKKIFFAHATDTKVHHNEAMFEEFRKGLDRRFSGVETSLSDISRKLDHLADRD